jgi:hypothetical protein
MKKIFFILYACFIVFIAKGQGTFKITPGANIKTTGNAYLLLDNMHIVNDGSFQQTSGNGYVKLTGSQNVNLSGSSSTIFNQLLLAKSGSSSLTLQSNISVLSQVNFSGGLLNLNNNVLDLGATGLLNGESETSRGYTTGSGYIQASGSLNNPSSANLGNLGAMISSTANLGNTVIRRGHAVQTGVSGSNNSISRFFDIIPVTNQNLKATLRFFYFDAELNGIPEATLHQYKSKDNLNWDFVGADSRNTTTNYVEKISINKFERNTLATAIAPVITCPANITTNANLNGCKASVAFAATATGIPAPVITYRINNTVITSPYVFSKGTTTVTVTASNGISPDDICSFTVTVACGSSGSPAINTTSSPNELESGQLNVNAFNVIAYPNPSKNNFSLSVQAETKEKIMMQVIDMNGRIIEVRNVSANSIIRFGDRYRPGTYIIRVIQGKKHKELKLVKLSD